jgi:hypothetical protein
LNLDKSVDNLSKRLSSFYPDTGPEIDVWKGRIVIPLEDWNGIPSVYEKLNYFPDRMIYYDFGLDRLVFLSLYLYDTYIDNEESQAKIRAIAEDPDLKEAYKKWKSDYLELMEHYRDPNYGNIKCYRCLLSPSWEEFGLFNGIYRVMANSLGYQDKPYQNIYPCPVVNRFKCPYDKTVDNREYPVTKDNIAIKSDIEPDYLFYLGKLAEAVEHAVWHAQDLGDKSVIWINSPQDLYEVLTNKEALEMVLNQGLGEERKKYKDAIMEFFTNPKIKDRVNINDLTFTAKGYTTRSIST